jgi:hypothetical protein
VAASARKCRPVALCMHPICMALEVLRMLAAGRSNQAALAYLDAQLFGSHWRWPADIEVTHVYLTPRPSPPSAATSPAVHQAWYPTWWMSIVM